MLRALGTFLIAGGTASADATPPTDGSYRVTQGNRSRAVEPLPGNETVEAFYGYHLPEGYTGTGVHGGGSGAYYESAGTRSLQRESTTITFLYDGPNGLSLVVVHDEATPGGDGGSATWEIFVRPADVKWLVEDDAYWEVETGRRATTNYDNWHTDGARQRIDWTWAAGATDGGALGYLKEQTALLIRPSYNERAVLAGEHYSGTITDWQFLSGDISDPDRIPLSLGEPAVITGPKRTGPPDAARKHGSGTDGPAAGAGQAAEETQARGERVGKQRGGSDEQAENESKENDDEGNDGGDGGGDGESDEGKQGGDGDEADDHGHAEGEADEDAAADESEDRDEDGETDSGNGGEPGRRRGNGIEDDANPGRGNDRGNGNGSEGEKDSERERKHGKRKDRGKGENRGKRKNRGKGEKRGRRRGNGA